MGGGDGIGRLNGPLRLVCTGVIDTLLHILAGQVEGGLVGHIADGLAVHLHRQRIGAVDDALKHCNIKGQRAQRQDVHGHPGQQPKVAPDAAGEKADAGFQRRTQALLLVDAVGVHQQRPDPLEEEDDGPKQILEHLDRAGKRRHSQIMGKFFAAACRPKGSVGDIAPGPDCGIFRRKAQCV